MESRKPTVWIEYSNTGEKFGVEIEGVNHRVITIGDLKNRICVERVIAVENQSISLNGVLMKDDDRLDENNIVSETMVSLNVIKPFPRCVGCTHTFLTEIRNPVNLDCGHFLCGPCYDTSFAPTITVDINPDTPAIASFACPCGRTSWRRQGCQVEIHDKMKNLVDWMNREERRYQDLRQTCSNVRCFRCKVVEAVVTCKPCDRPFCDECDQLVHGNVYQDHERCPLIATYIEDFPMCSAHPSEKCCLYCRKDKVLVCNSCIVEFGPHFQHSVVQPTQAANEIKYAILSQATELSEAEARLVERNDTLAERLESITVESEKAIKRIHRYFNSLVDALRRREIELVKRVRKNQYCRELPCIELRRLYGDDLSQLHVRQESCKQLLLCSHLSLIEGRNNLEISVPTEALNRLMSAPTIHSDPCATVSFFSGDALRQSLGCFGMVGGPDPPHFSPPQGIGLSSAEVSWGPSVPSVGKYQLELSCLPDLKFEPVYSGPATRFKLHSLRPATRYAVRVRGECLNGGGLGDWSETLDFCTQEASLDKLSLSFIVVKMRSVFESWNLSSTSLSASGEWSCRWAFWSQLLLSTFAQKK